MIRERCSITLDPTLINLLRPRHHRGLNQPIETILIAHFKAIGTLPADYEPIGELRGTRSKNDG